uniref:RBR-type E3 ubiquitin transferase n=1 Tax=Paramoeba aestuarina TaxID=180227 RepID=A0A7S4L2T4_9EUKA|eukprot:CAMPEP_0201535296 /NCGR_PEP_ID=MMETSP0161_2-20130828/58622_1 /ASSEMBLY_ACC=CAM_ASM_000251 /TAXON_ID=180227 /ORGANISM="Neoparamoeba aestuarina, Strain SoJaBio B1-5/56/2" /LENGTH=480 /DNA_ID=CAMNT_0047940385 /DNA_START=171 /DNA_END=1613 /DNA_ORIENTATION=+
MAAESELTFSMQGELFEEFAYEFMHGKGKEEEEPEDEGLRYSVDFPLLQTALVGHLEGTVSNDSKQNGYQKFGTIEEMMKAGMELLKVAQEKGHEGRCEMLQMFLATLASIVGQTNRMSMEVFSPAQLEIHYPQIPDDLNSDPSSSSSSSVPYFPPASLGGSSSSAPSPSPSPLLADQNCPICFEDYPSTQMRTLMSCGSHFTCKDCMELHLTTLISDVQTVQKLHCPDPTCPHVANEWELEPLIGTKNFKKYLDMITLAALKPDQGEGGVWWCPNDKCRAPIAKEELGENKKVTCPGCQTEFCGECGGLWHEGKTCEEAEKMRDSTSFTSWLEKKGDKVKPCPKCKFGIEKNSGCNHMTCQQCNFQWCWLCHLAYLDEELYPNGHYGLGSPCNELRMTDADTLEEAYEKENKTKNAVDNEVENFQRDWEAGAAERERQAEEYRRLVRRNRARRGPILVARGARNIITAPIRFFRGGHDN